MTIGSSLNVGKAAGQWSGTMGSAAVPLLIPLNKSKEHQPKLLVELKQALFLYTVKPVQQLSLPKVGFEKTALNTGHGVLKAPNHKVGRFQKPGDLQRLLASLLVYIHWIVSRATF